MIKTKLGVVLWLLAAIGAAAPVAAYPPRIDNGEGQLALPAPVIQFNPDGTAAPTGTADNPLYVNGGGGGTQYIYGAAAPAAPVGTYAFCKEVDTIASAGESNADNAVLRCNAKHELYIKTTDTDALLTAGNLKLDSLVMNTAAATPAGEAFIGQVGGNQSTTTVAQTVTASSAYSSGNAVGGLITFANASRVANGSGLVQSVVAYTKSAQTAALELWLFNTNPSGSTCTDKTAFSVAAADFDKVVWVTSISSWYSGGTPSVGVSTDHAIPFALASGTSLYGCLVARSTPTYASTSDVSVAIRVIRN